MDENLKAWLYDILQAIDEIESYFLDVPKTFKNYISDINTKRAVERDLEIIGEAVNRISNKDINVTLSNSRKIITTRNRITHAYDAIADDLIWSIVINHLPLLKKEVRALIESFS